MVRCVSQIIWLSLLTTWMNQAAAQAEPEPINVPPAHATTAATDSKHSSSLFRHSTYPAAWTAANKTNRPILVYVTMPGCPHCSKMIQEIYQLPKINKLVSTSFETLHANRRSHSKLVSKLRIKWYPTTVLVGPNNKVLDMIEGYVDGKTLNRRLLTSLAAAEPPTQTR